MSKQQKIWIGVGVSVVVIIAAILVILSIRSQNNSTGSSSTYQTTTVQMGTLTSAVEGSGTVASAQSANLTWQTSGQVDKVIAQIGDQVKAGDVLANLLSSSLSPNVLSAQLDLATAQQSLNNLLHPTAATLATAQVSLANAYTGYNTASTNLYNAIYKYQSSGDSTLFDTLVTNRNYMVYALNAVPLATADMKVQLYYWAARAVQLGQTDMDYAAIAKTLRTQIDATMADKVDTLVTAQANYESAVTNFAASLTDSPSATSINSSFAAYRNSAASLASAQQNMYTLTVTPDPNAVAAAQAKVDAAQATVNQAQITAPFAGTITQVNVLPGNVVSAGTKAFRIDNMSPMLVTVTVTEIDVNGVKSGQPATITFDAIPNKTYNGTVIEADLAGTVSQNSVNFSVTVQLTDSDTLIRPGMAANVTITTNQVANALLIPTTAIFTDTTGQQYVYLVQNDGSTTTVPVTVGAVSDTTTQITGNSLKEGDVIVLSFASTSTSDGGIGLGGLGGLGGGGRVIQSQPQPVVTP